MNLFVEKLDLGENQAFRKGLFWDLCTMKFSHVLRVV